MNNVQTAENVCVLLQRCTLLTVETLPSAQAAGSGRLATNQLVKAAKLCTRPAGRTAGDTSRGLNIQTES